MSSNLDKHDRYIISLKIREQIGALYLKSIKNGKLPAIRAVVKRPDRPWQNYDCIAGYEDLDLTANIAFLCGKSTNNTKTIQVFVIDLDKAKNDNEIDGEEWFRAKCENLGISLKDVLQVRTGSGGAHVYFKYDPERDSELKTSTKLKIPHEDKIVAIDFRTTGGIIIAPFSIHETGNLYIPFIGEQKEDAQGMLDDFIQGIQNLRPMPQCLFEVLREGKSTTGSAKKKTPTRVGTKTIPVTKTVQETKTEPVEKTVQEAEPVQEQQAETIQEIEQEQHTGPLPAEELKAAVQELDVRVDWAKRMTAYDSWCIAIWALTRAGVDEKQLLEWSRRAPGYTNVGLADVQKVREQTYNSSSRPSTIATIWKWANEDKPKYSVPTVDFEVEMEEVTIDDEVIKKLKSIQEVIAAKPVMNTFKAQRIKNLTEKLLAMANAEFSHVTEGIINNMDRIELFLDKIVKDADVPPSRKAKLPKDPNYFIGNKVDIFSLFEGINWAEVVNFIRTNKIDRDSATMFLEQNAAIIIDDAENFITKEVDSQGLLTYKTHQLKELDKLKFTETTTAIIDGKETKKTNIVTFRDLILTPFVLQKLSWSTKQFCKDFRLHKDCTNRTIFNTNPGMRAYQLARVLSIKEKNQEVVKAGLADIHKVITHLCGCDEDQVTLFYKFLAYKIQFPDKKMQKFNILLGPKGIGKTSLIRDFYGNAIIGQSMFESPVSMTAWMNTLGSSNNAFIAQKTLVYLDDLRPDDLKKHEDEIKQETTASSARVRELYKNHSDTQVEMTIDYWASTNFISGLHIDGDDRRYTVFQGDDYYARKENQAEIIRIAKEVYTNPEIQVAFYKLLMGVDLAGFEPTASFTSKIKREAVMNSMPPHIQFIKDLYTGEYGFDAITGEPIFELPAVDDKCWRVKKLWKEYESWRKNANIEEKQTERAFTIALASFLGAANGVKEMKGSDNLYCRRYQDNGKEGKVAVVIDDPNKLKQKLLKAGYDEDSLVMLEKKIQEEEKKQEMPEDDTL